MSKYIDAEKLIAEIERLKVQLIRGACSSQVAMETNCKDEAYNEVLSFITSLQQEQLIDKNTLTWRDVNEIERLINKVYYEFPYGIGEEAFGKLVLERFIDGKDDLQEQPEVAISYEEELKEWMDYGPHTCYPWTSIPDAIKITAEHFYNLGLNARKEE